ncbi:MAG: hypothetical protein HYV93_07035 [Candidatus Rokubacteria bacterium]|nr:hypothetical protein [Candidatus Rokubacteria bacterium]
MSSRGRRLLGAGLLAALLGLALAWRFGAPVAFTLALAFPSTERWLAPVARDAIRTEVSFGAGGRPVHADLYRRPGPRGALVLVHGLSPAGRRHPELMRLARLLARHGLLVLVPHVEGLAALRLGGREVDEIRAAIQHAAGLGDRVGVVGLSFGAGPALLAAATLPEVRLAGSFGGYADLRHVIAYISTGVHELGGRRYVQRHEEYNRWKLVALLAGFVDSERDREGLAAIARRKLADPADPTTGLESALGEAGQAAMALALNRREDLVAPLLSRLPSRALEALDRLSPLPAIPTLHGRLLIAHGSGDESIPFTESLRLAQAAEGRARVVILESFHHTGPRGVWEATARRALDGWRLLRLADELLAL